MVQDHVGLSGEEGDRLAGDMEAHMQDVHGADAGQMIQSCAAGSDGTTGTGGSGMMGGPSSAGTTLLYPDGARWERFSSTAVSRRTSPSAWGPA